MWIAFALRSQGRLVVDDGAAEALGLPLAKTALTLKQVYADASGQGTVVWRMGSRGRDAAQETEALFREVLPSAVKPKGRG